MDEILVIEQTYLDLYLVFVNKKRKELFCIERCDAFSVWLFSVFYPKP
jgi:hypothetical protein